MKTVILDQTQIERIIRRIAHQIVEHCFEEPEIIIIGIKPRGTWVAQQIDAQLKSLINTPITMLSVNADSKDDFDSIASQITGKCLIIVDDILNSGKTMMHTAAHISLRNPSKLITACLVDRLHRKFPIHSDFTGLSLATTLQEHLTLDIENGPIIFLN